MERSGDPDGTSEQHSWNAERARFEEELRELSDRLRAAEEKNQRALSMAQQKQNAETPMFDEREAAEAVA